MGGAIPPIRTKDGPMSRRTKTISRAVGVLYLLGTIFGVLGVVATNDVANSSDTLAAAASDQAPLAIGALLVLAMGSVLAMIPIT